jgi:hypothetical protein
MILGARKNTTSRFAPAGFAVQPPDRQIANPARAENTTSRFAPAGFVIQPPDRQIANPARAEVILLQALMMR